MFTGIIEEIGTIRDVIKRGPGLRVSVNAGVILQDLKVDQSVAVNGVCLTAVETGDSYFSADAVAETLEKSTLHNLRKNDAVNLERALRLQDRLGGHLVQGHVDGVGVIRRLTQETHASTLMIEIPQELQRYTIAKGSIAIDGISLTIAEKNLNMLTVAVIPHTMQWTTFQYKKTGDRVNVEVDLMAKYVEQFLTDRGETKISMEWLKQQGF